MSPGDAHRQESDDFAVGIRAVNETVATDANTVAGRALELDQSSNVFFPKRAEVDGKIRLSAIRCPRPKRQMTGARPP